MAVGLSEPTEACQINGVRLSTAAAGIRYKNRDDVALIEIAQHSSIAAVFTQNKFCAAPVELAINHLQEKQPRYLIVNAGNANAGTGASGLEAAIRTTQAIANLTGVRKEEVLPFSTGVIGEQLEVVKIEEQLEGLIENLSKDRWLSAAKAIMTTDTVSKAYSKKIQLNGNEVSITGIAKGSGMIQPNMATMLSYVATDLEIQRETLQKLLIQGVEKSFNSITVDSDTSTNDACVLIATGKSTSQFESLSKEEQIEFSEALNDVLEKLAQAIVRDGEGATKFVTVSVKQAINDAQAKTIAYSIANSPLVKTALAASDPNWGRIMAAVGKCNDKDLELSKAGLVINDISIMEQGELSPDYTDEIACQAMLQDDINIEILLGLGDCQSVVWTSDLTHEYVRINAEYRS